MCANSVCEATEIVCVGAGALLCLAGDHGVFGTGVWWCRECDAVSCGPLRAGAVGGGWRVSKVWAGSDGNMSAGVWSHLACLGIGMGLGESSAVFPRE